MLYKKNLEKYWDTQKVCKNPNKGWYFHYYDNGIERYHDELERDDYLLDFPGLNHIYIRVPWSYLEPKEGFYNWRLIDQVTEEWVPQGYTFSFRITCKETSPGFATPEWVKEAGARGTFLPCEGEDLCWEPDYGDPIFLEKLDGFHQAFSERYDTKTWVEYIDIGSYGDWGEGHTAASSQKDWPIEVIKNHIDIHCKYYKKSLLMISDDVVNSRKVEDGSRDEILAYLILRGVSIRDDGISVKFFAENYGQSTLRSPEMFELFWRRTPIDLELQHYHITLEEGLWLEGVPLEKAIQEAHATYAGFHGHARKWLRENEDFAHRMANRLGYWYFPKSVEWPSYIRRGEEMILSIVWENHGVAPAYRKYDLYVKLEDCEGVVFVSRMENSDNRTWLPGHLAWEKVTLYLPYGLNEGAYKISISLRDPATDRSIEIGLQDQFKSIDGFYGIGELMVKE